jgi:phage-related minor tail protein
MAIVIPVISTFDGRGVDNAMGKLKQLVDSNKTRSEKMRMGAQIAGAGILAGAGAAAVGLFKVGESFDDAFDKIRIGTGATGPELDALKGVMKNVAGDVPASFGDAATAVTILTQKLGLSGKPLQKMSDQVLELSRMTGTDLQSNLDSVAGVMNNFGVTAADQSGKLDELFRASQSSGVAVSDLAGQMASSGAQLRSVGLDFEQSAGLLGTLGKAGLDAGDVMPALGKAMAEAAKHGQSAQDVFQTTFSTIKNAPSDVDASGAALDVFGAKAGPKLAALIREGKLSYEDMVGSITKGKDTIMGASGDTQDFGEKLTKLKNKVFLALEPIATRVFNAVGNAMDKIGPIVENITKWMNKHKGVMIAVAAIIGGVVLTVLAAYTISMLGAAAATVAATWPILLIIAAIGLLVVGVMYAWKHFAWFRTAVMAVWHAIQKVIQVAWEIIKIYFKAIVWYIKNVLVPVFTAIWDVVKTVFGVVIDIISGAWDKIKGVFKWIKNGVKGVIDIFGTIVDGITSAFSTLGDIILSPFKWAFNQIAKIWNGTVGQISFKTPSWMGPLGNKGFDVPKIPEWKAVGGSVMGGNPYIVGEQGPELFVPGMSGSIVPNHRLGGGGGTVIQNITITSNDPQQVVNALIRYQQRNGVVPIRTAA